VISPIVLDLDGKGFHMTDLAGGVLFQVFPNVAQAYQISWTAAKADNAWLVLDRNGNGLIDDFGEMFGNITLQPDPPPGQDRNGFLALAVFDQPENGGNGDGWISKDDAVFFQLRVWQDTNHNGVSEADELHTLQSVGVKAIALRYKLSDRVDDYGNQFRYRATVRDMNDSDVGKAAYDVLLLIGKAVAPSN
jgi:hypothetical protein